MSELLNIVSKEDFEEKVSSSTGIVVVDIFTDWCGPCKVMLPVLKELQEEVVEKAIIYKLNADAVRDLVVSMGIKSIPTLIFFKDGKEVNRLTGARSKSELLSIIESL